MRLRLVAHRFRRLLCMAGVHQFADGRERCVAPGCRAPNEHASTREAVEQIGATRAGSHAVPTETESAATR
jgi:hypothetical protein